MSSLQQNNTTIFLRFLTIVLNLCLHIKRKQNPGLIFFFFFLATSHRLWDLSSPTRDQIHVPLHWKHEVLTTQQPGKSPKTLCFTGVNSTLDRNDIMPSVQWLGHHAFTAGGLGSIPGWRIKILQPIRLAKKKKKPERTRR